MSIDAALGIPSRYEILERAGEGAVAVVLRALDRELGREVAIKVLHERHAESSQMYDRFVREARILAGLAHPNVVSVYDVGSAGGRPFMVMEFVRGRSLSEALKEGLMRVDAAVRLAQKVAHGVAAAHARSVIHRDLKPANILLTATGEPKVGDFGLAHVTEGAALTKTGSIVGTPLYMAPEQIRGEAKSVGPATDVYALGAILYEALTGRVPHTAETLPEIYQKVLSDEPVPPRDLRAEVDAELQAVVMKALDKSPTARYRDAADFAEDLRRYLAGEAVRASRSGTLRRLVRKAKAQTGVLVPVALAVAFVGAWAGWTLWSGAKRATRFRTALATAQALETAGRLDDALAAFSVAAEIDASQALGREGRARVKALLEKAAEAARDFEESRPPLDRAEVLYYREPFDLSEVVRHVETAMRSIATGLSKAPRSGLGHYLLGRAWDLQGEPERALQELRKAVELDPTLSAARLLLARVLIEESLLTTPEAARRETGSSDTGALAQSRGLEAVQQIEEAQRRGGLVSGSERACGLAMLAYLAHRNDEVLRVAVEVAPDDRRSAGMELVHLLCSRVAPKGQRVPHMKESLSIRPQYALTRFIRAVDCVMAGRIDEAIDWLQQVIAIRPSLGIAWQYLGSAQWQRGDIPAAERSLGRALELQPRDIASLVNLAQIRRGAGDPEGAQALAERAVAEEPENSRAQAEMGHCRVARRDYEGAAAAFTRALEAWPDNVDALVNRSGALAMLGRVDDAIADLRRAIGIEAGSVAAHANLCRALLLNKDAAGAMAAANEAVRSVPDNANLLLLRAELRMRMDDRAGARADLQAVIRLAPSGGAVAQQAQELLKRLATE